MDYRKELDHWAGVWDKALEKNLFPKTPEASPPSALNGTESFFGLKSRAEDAPTSPSEPDAAYWNKVYHMSKDSGFGKAPDILSESVKAKDAPNPVKANTVGSDQDLTPESLDATFSEKDIEDLSVLKVKLHELQDKMNEFEGRGENSKKFESQISKIKSQIDELSSSLTRSFDFKD